MVIFVAAAGDRQGGSPVPTPSKTTGSSVAQLHALASHCRMLHTNEADNAMSERC